MSEEEIIGTDFDRALRAAVMGLGQAVETVQRTAQERNRRAAEEAQAELRSTMQQQEQLTRTLHKQVGREAFWESATGERVANAATYGATLSQVNPSALDVYEIVREEAHKRYGIDVDALRAGIPGSEEERRNALMHAVDDFLQAKREEAATQDAGRTLDAAERDVDEAKEEAAEAGAGSDADERTDAAERAADDAASDVAGHESERDRLTSEGRREEGIGHRAEGDVAGQRVAAAAAPTTAAGKASKTASTSYPHDASETLTQSRKVAQPKARVNRGGTAQKERVAELGR